MYSVKFTNNKFDVTLAGDGQAAVTKLREGYEPDIILLDVVMPVMDGVEALNIIRKEGLAKRAGIMMLSNQGQPSDIEKAKEYNVDGYIVKATSIPSEIITETLNLLERTKARREGPMPETPTSTPAASVPTVTLAENSVVPPVVVVPFETPETSDAV